MMESGVARMGESGRAYSIAGRSMSVAGGFSGRLVIWDVEGTCEILGLEVRAAGAMNCPPMGVEQRVGVTQNGSGSVYRCPGAMKRGSGARVSRDQMVRLLLTFSSVPLKNCAMQAGQWNLPVLPR